jgi:hypothetical protein
MDLNCRCFCVHPRTGNVLDYYALKQYLNREQPIYGLQARGLSSGEVLDYRLKLWPVPIFESYRNFNLQAVLFMWLFIWRFGSL